MIILATYLVRDKYQMDVLKQKKEVLKKRLKKIFASKSKTDKAKPKK